MQWTATDLCGVQNFFRCISNDPPELMPFLKRVVFISTLGVVRTELMTENLIYRPVLVLIEQIQNGN